jgi:TetR/AcrR family transcriptional regulator, lmrAB and yxaGH operons repressor
MTVVVELQYSGLVTPDTRSDTRRKMIAGAAVAIGTRGVGAMSLRDLAKEAGVPLGSTYHHFPGGKAQLAEEAVTSIGRKVSRLVDKARAEGIEAALAAFARVWRELLVDTDFRTGCPVLAVATGDDPDLTDTARAIFASWQDLMVEGLVADGVLAERAPGLARMIIASLEGAVAVSRAERSLEPLDEVSAELVTLVQSARGGYSQAQPDSLAGTPPR